MGTKTKGRRAWGSGSLFEERQPSGRVVWIGQTRVNGKQRQRTLGQKVGPKAITKRQAEAALREFTKEVEAQAASEARDAPPRASLSTVANEHLDFLESSDTKATTIADYRGYLRRHIEPHFGDVDMSTIRVRDVEAFVAHQRRPKSDGGKGLKGATVLNQVNYLHAIYAFAQRREYVDSNPVSAASKPRAGRRTTKFSFLSPAEVDAVLAAVADDDLGPTDRAIILTAAFTGLRQGELIALRWEDIDWLDGFVSVTRSVSRGKEGTAKSERSVREVPLANQVAVALELHFGRSRYKADTDRVFCHPHTGNPYDPSKMRDRFYAAMKSAGLGHMIGRDGGGITFHSLRHTFGTHMASSPGVTLVALKDWMGHADIATTMIYAKWGKDRAADRALVDAAFGHSVQGGTISGKTGTPSVPHAPCRR